MFWSKKPKIVYIKIPLAHHEEVLRLYDEKEKPPHSSLAHYKYHQYINKILPNKPPGGILRLMAHEPVLEFEQTEEFVEHCRTNNIQIWTKSDKPKSS